MAYFTKEQIEQAKRLDLLTYLQNYNPEELVHESRNSYTTRTHDSLKISNGMWYWFSRGVGGRSALEYLIQVEEYSFTGAVGHILGQRGFEKVVSRKQPLTEKEKIDRLIMSKKADNNLKVISYLQSRGISKNIIDECINKDFIYQDSPNNNVVFVGFDEKNNPRYAGVRGTNSSRYMHEASGSDKSYSFKLESIIKKDDLHLFESAIDLLSYATFKELNNERWDEENLLSLAGIYQPSKDNLNSKMPKALIQYLKNNTNINKIYLHLDNDEKGREASKAIKDFFSVRYEIIDEPPKCGKDYNDFLCSYLKINSKNQCRYYR